MAGRGHRWAAAKAGGVVVLTAESGSPPKHSYGDHVWSWQQGQRWFAKAPCRFLGDWRSWPAALSCPTGGFWCNFPAQYWWGAQTSTHRWHWTPWTTARRGPSGIAFGLRRLSIIFEASEAGRRNGTTPALVSNAGNDTYWSQTQKANRKGQPIALLALSKGVSATKQRRS